ncbi:hypothetical protein [Nocardia rhamnosiphila]|uniref:Uncharacterized protein n=1 Tax=Nocardia rhamnosiphila TaxID=426716 RepID=A0ABV2WXR7_9NOCA
MADTPEKHDPLTWLVFGSGKTPKSNAQRWAPVFVVLPAAVIGFAVWDGYGPIVFGLLTAVVGATIVFGLGSVSKW